MELPVRNKLQEYCQKELKGLPTVDAKLVPSGKWLGVVILPDGRSFFGTESYVKKQAETTACEVALRELFNTKLYLIDGRMDVRHLACRRDCKVIPVGDAHMPRETRIANIYYTLGKCIDEWSKQYNEIIFVSQDLDLYFPIPNVRIMRNV